MELGKLINIVIRFTIHSLFRDFFFLIGSLFCDLNFYDLLHTEYW